MERCGLVVIFALFLVGAALPGLAASPKELAKDKPVGKIEPAAFFSGPMPTGVTVSRSGRIFVNFPQWGDKVDATVAEVKKGKTVPYPNEKINRCDKGDQKDCFVSVQSVVVDPKDRVWVLDTGSVGFGPTTYGGPKMVGINLNTNQIFKTIIFPQDVALTNTYLNDVWFDRIYLSDYEHNAIHRMMPDGSIETIAHDARMLWPDTLSLAYDGYLYFTVNQIERQAAHQAGKDLREKPYAIFRIKIDAEPVALK